MTKTHRTPALPRIPGVSIRYVRHHRGYAVGDDGSVWSARRTGHRHRLFDWRRLVPHGDRHGYLSIKLNRQRIGVHRLVLRAFRGRCPAGMESRHLDGNPSNNWVGNLLWGTPKQNQADRLKHGTDQNGARNPNAKLTERHIPKIRELDEAGATADAIGWLFSVHPRTIRAALRGETWANAA